jgi:protein-S-isoprenylcysteine O-methyltransferase Ste14
MDLSLSTLTYIPTLLLSNYICYLCLTPPRPGPSPSKDTPKDRLNAWRDLSKPPKWRWRLVFTVWTYQIVLILFPSRRSSLCRNPEFLNQDLFGWSTRTIIAFAVIFVFGGLRLRAYKGLGRNFTFQLARPSGLITTGIYAWVQHPSYLGLWAVRTVDFFTLNRLDGVLSCVMPRWWERVLSVPYLSEVLAMGLSVGMAGVLWVRVRDEEEMMRREFGKEWEVWHGRTARFIPGVF